MLKNNKSYIIVALFLSISCDKVSFSVPLVDSYRYIPSIQWHQSFAIHSDHLISVNYHDDTDSSIIKGQIINLNDWSIIDEIIFDYSSYKRPHCNTICFSNKFYSSESYFPLLYISQWDYNSERGVLVYDIYKVDNNFFSRLVQTIIPGNIDCNILGNGSLDYIVDYDKNELYSLAYFIKGPSTIIEDNKHMIVKYKLPKISDGTVIYLKEDDILDYYELDVFNYSQDKCYRKGKMYVISGGGGIYSHFNKLRVINLKTKSVETCIDLSSILYELEGLDFYKDSLLFSTGSLFYNL